MGKIINLKQEIVQQLYNFLEEYVENDTIRILDDIKNVEEQVYDLLSDKGKLHLLQFITQEEYSSIIQFCKIDFIDKYM